MTAADGTTVRLPELDTHCDRLVTQHTDRGFDEQVVRARLDHICGRLASARVRTYLPLLVERALRIELEVV